MQVNAVVGSLLVAAGVAGIILRKKNFAFWSRAFPTIELSPRPLLVAPVLTVLLGVVFKASAVLNV